MSLQAKQKQKSFMRSDEEEMKELITNLRIRFQWAFIGYSDEVDREINQFAVWAKQHAEHLDRVTVCFGKG